MLGEAHLPAPAIQKHTYQITSSEKSLYVAFIHHNTIPRDDTPTSLSRLVLLLKRRNLSNNSQKINANNNKYGQHVEHTSLPPVA
jgi:hypothetical protein